jgi:hypothetical protein
MPIDFKGLGSPWFGLKEGMYIKNVITDIIFGSGSYNSVPVVLHLLLLRTVSVPYWARCTDCD